MSKFMKVPPRRSRSLFAVAALSLILAACGDRPLSTMDPESPIAETLDTFLVALLIVCALVFVLVQGAVIYMARRFSVRAPDDESQVYPDEEFPEQVHGNTRLEIGWTIAPTVIMAVVGFFTLGVLFQLDDVSASDDRQIQSVTVVGQQWWWEFQYHLDDDGVPDIVTAGELVLPVGEEIALDVTSRDVIHSFWVPALNGKRDAVPGQTSWWTIEVGDDSTNIDRRFPGECTEFCGLSHAYMEKYVVGLSMEDWKAWAANQMEDAEVPAEGSEAYEGWLVFEAQCASCHVINGLTSLGAGTEDTPKDSFAIYDGANRLIDKQTQVAGVAPNLTKFATRSSFAGGIFDLYQDVLIPESQDTDIEGTFRPDRSYLDLAESARLNRGDLERWIVNAPEMKANAWDSPTGGRGMRPFEALSAEDVDHLVAFLTSLD